MTHNFPYYRNIKPVACSYTDGQYKKSIVALDITSTIPSVCKKIFLLHFTHNARGVWILMD